MINSLVVSVAVGLLGGILSLRFPPPIVVVIPQGRQPGDPVRDHLERHGRGRNRPELVPAVLLPESARPGKPSCQKPKFRIA